MIPHMIHFVAVTLAFFLLGEAAGQPAQHSRSQTVTCYENNVVVVGRASDQHFALVRFPNTRRSTSVLVERIHVEQVIFGAVRHRSFVAYEITHVSPRTDVPLLFVLAPSQVPKFTYEIVSDSWLGDTLPKISGPCVNEPGTAGRSVR